jgi:asparagine synthase (glutamine-hydrolysing)
MCGLAGIFAAADFRHDAKAAASKMQAKLLHRGPDDRGLYFSRQGACALAHTRLAVLDLSSAGHQPMSTADGRYTIIFNGEIYNFRDLRDELAKDGEEFSSRSDTEVVLRLYARYGAASFARLRGMFALSIWDEQIQRLVVARDRFGIKPLYYCAGGTVFLCASEVRALLASDLIARKLDRAGLAAYLRFGSLQDSSTLIDGVKMLRPGHCLSAELTGGAIHVRELPFAQPLADAAKASDGIKREDAAAELRRRLEDSVRHHLVSDRPLGVFLSGGIDSSALVALLKQVGEHAPKTFSVIFPEGDFSEAAHARLVAETFATDHREILLAEDRLQSLIPAAIAAMDQPTMDGINTYVVSNAVKEAGVTVALSGLGGDELFAGYPSFNRARRLDRLTAVPHSLRESAASLGHAAFNGTARRDKFWRLLESDCSPFAAYAISRELFTSAEVHALLPGSDCVPDHTPAHSRADIVNAVSLCELQGYMVNTLLRDTDQMSMAHALEVRVPFVDSVVMDYLLGLPGAWKIERHRPKPLLLDALDNRLPEFVWRRPKMGFTLPFERWLRSSLRDEIELTLANPRMLTQIGLAPEFVTATWRRFADQLRCQTWTRPWSLYVLDRWCELNSIRP